MRVHISDAIGALALFAVLLTGSAIGYGLDQTATPAEMVEVPQ